MSSAGDVLGALGGNLSGASTALAGAGTNLQSILSGIDANTPAGTPSLSGAASMASTSAGTLATDFAIFTSPSRLAAFVIGIILIGAGVLMFKGTTTVITTATKAAGALAA
jgi:hypothetical protein